MFKFFIKQLLLLSISLIVISCDDDNDSGDRHTNAKGFILENEANGDTYRYFKGDVEGSISLDVGEEIEFVVHFLDDDGEEIEHSEDDDHDDEEKYLEFSEYDSNIVLIEQVEGHNHNHDEMEIRIVGISSGFTSCKLELMHGDNHADYETIDNTPIQITVN